MDCFIISIVDLQRCANFCCTADELNVRKRGFKDDTKVLGLKSISNYSNEGENLKDLGDMKLKILL